MPFFLAAASTQDLELSRRAPIFLELRGRLNRLRYFGWMAITWGVVAVGALFAAAVPEAPGIVIPFFIIATVLQIGPTVQRLHDLNLSGWLFLFFLLPVVNILFSLILFIAKGTEGPNRYGPDPLQSDQTEDLTRSQPISSDQGRETGQSEMQTAKESSKDAWLETGLHQMQNRNYKRAEEIFGDAVKQGVSQIDEAHFRLGQVRALRGNHERAVLDYSGALEKRESPVILYFRGISRALVDDHEEAERDWKRAINIDSGEIETDKIDLDDLGAESAYLKRKCKNHIRSSLNVTLTDLHGNSLNEKQTDSSVEDVSKDEEESSEVEHGQWFYSDWEERFGPVSESTLKSKIKEGDIERNHLIWKTGMEDWKRVDEVFDDLTIPPPLPPHEPE